MKLLHRLIKYLKSIHIHNWQYTQEVYYDRDDAFTSIEDPDEPATRTCSKCGKYQEKDIHCLGLNPPEYVRTWISINDKH